MRVVPVFSGFWQRFTIEFAIFAKSKLGMQFIYPQLFWALFLLLIPIFIHLFQLRRFKKTPFTNVQLLRKVVAESRRSRNLKKWLLLFTRMLLLTALVFAFAQPFIAGPTALAQKQQVIYLDNSFSMQGPAEDGSLLENAVQELLKSIPGEETFTLITNESVFEDVHVRDIQNELLSLPYSYRQLSLREICLKADSYFDAPAGTVRDLVVLSDFQQNMAAIQPDSTVNFKIHLVQLEPKVPENASIDSVYISNSTPSVLELTAIISRTGERDALPVSLHNADTLIAKTSAVWEPGENSTSIVFSLPSRQRIEGIVSISDGWLSYDNRMYFTIDNKEKIRVLSVGKTPASVLNRIYTDEEFDFQAVSLSNLNYSTLASQNLIILNELEAIPNALQNVLLPFRTNGGSLVVIPSTNADLGSYNTFMSSLSGSRFQNKISASRDITGIAFSHPLFANVFEREVTNFQFPSVSEYYPIRSALPSILTLQGGDAFLSGNNNCFIFSTPLEEAGSNFRNSPLIVPTFYNIGTSSLKLPELYYQVGENAEVDIPVFLGQDQILHVSSEGYDFIPPQQSFANKTTVGFGENPARDGHFLITDAGNPLKRVSFNYNRTESDLTYIPVSTLSADSRDTDIGNLFETFKNANSVDALWKWFVILALLCLLAEMLIQKFLK